MYFYTLFTNHGINSVQMPTLLQSLLQTIQKIKFKSQGIFNFRIFTRLSQIIFRLKKVTVSQRNVYFIQNCHCFAFEGLNFELSDWSLVCSTNFYNFNDLQFRCTSEALLEISLRVVRILGITHKGFKMPNVQLKS